MINSILDLEASVMVEESLDKAVGLFRQEMCFRTVTEYAWAVIKQASHNSGVHKYLHNEDSRFSADEDVLLLFAQK